MAVGYLLALLEDWDKAVVERAALRKILIRDGLRAVDETRMAIGWARAQGDQGWNLAPLERWMEDLEEAFEDEQGDEEEGA